MTREEKEKRAEEKARRKAELNERKVRRKAQLAALQKYWFLLSYDINGRACPQEFFMFWARQLIAMSKGIPYLLLGLFNAIRCLILLPVLIVVVAILCYIFPPLLLYLEWTAIMFSWTVIMGLTSALIMAAVFMPIFLAAVKRRINDVSSTAVMAHGRFILFAAIVGAMLVSLIVSAFTWFDIPLFATNGALSFLAYFAKAVLIVGALLTLWQLHYYTFSPGVKGKNFAGANPVEVPITESSILASSSCVASRAWQVAAIALIIGAAIISFGISTAFVRTINTLAMFDLVFKVASLGLIGTITYVLQGGLVVVLVFMAVFKWKYKKGDLASSELASINEFFMAKSSLPIEEFKSRAMQSAEGDDRSGEHKNIIRRLGFIFRTFTALIYWPVMLFAVVYILRCNFVETIMLLAVAWAALAYYNHFKSNEGENLGKINWMSLIAKSGKQLLFFGREVVMLPYGLSDEKFPAGTTLPMIAKKRLRMRNFAFIDPLGIHQFAMGQLEMGCIQILFCILIVGFPISWLWSIFDGIRFSRMSDEQFLAEYSDYCFSKGVMDKFVRLMSKIAVFVVPIVVLQLFLALSLSSDGGAERMSKEKICIMNMKDIVSAYQVAKLDKKKVESISDLCRMEYLDEMPKCPNGGKYLLENGRIICTVDTAKIDKRRAEEAAKEADRHAVEAQNASDRDACIENMRVIESAYEFARVEGKKVNDISDLNEWLREKSKDLDLSDYEDLPAKCPSGGKYKLDQYGRVTCSRSEDGHILTP